MVPSINSSFSQTHYIHFSLGFQLLLEIQETGNSDKGANVTICDLVAQLEGHDKVAPYSHILSQWCSLWITVFPCIRISNQKWKPGLKWIHLQQEKLPFMERAILNALYSLLISETFILFPFHSLVPILQFYMYLILLTQESFLIQYLGTYTSYGSVV